MIGIVILAAGNSSRLGEPKQLLSYGDQTLVRQITETALQVSPNKTVVVLGAHSDQIEPELIGLACSTVKNENWQDGLASSITTGLAHLLSTQELDAAIFVLCDQPLVSSALLRRIIYEYRSADKGIVASAYEDTVGTPALFAAKYFADLLRLTGSKGAKKLFELHRKDLITTPFPEGGIDVDTKEDYQKLLETRLPPASSVVC